jgi:hypothetical protein
MTRANTIYLKMVLFWKEIDFILTVAGIYTAFLYYGVVQEKIYKSDEGQQPFHHPEIVVLVQCICGFIVGGLGALIFERNPGVLKEPKKPDDGRWKYELAYGTTYIASMVSTNTSL